MQFEISQDPQPPPSHSNSEFFFLAFALSLLAASTAFGQGPETKSIATVPAQACSRMTTFQALAREGTDCLAKTLAAMDPEEWDKSGNRVLHRAAELGRIDAARFLLARGADLRALNGYGAASPKVAAERAGNREMAEFLDFTEAETERLTRAIEAKAIAFVRGSLARGAALGARDIRYDTPLHLAAQGGDARIGSLLLQHRAPINAKNYLGNTPLHEAIVGGNSEFASLLVRAGASLNIENERRETPLDFAESDGNAKVVALLRSAGAKRGARRDLELGTSGGDGEGIYPPSGSLGSQSPRP